MGDQLGRRTVALNLDISQSTVLTVLKMSNFHSTKMKMVHKLTDDDPDRPQQYCEIVPKDILQNTSYLKHIRFSDEATFCERLCA